jgi:hypothetical protein
MARCWLLLALTVLVLGGCRGDRDRGAHPGRSASKSAAPAATPQADPADIAVVRGWSDDLRRGDVKAASARFAVPSSVANNTPVIRLETRGEVEFFNESLPCGSKLLSTERRRGLIIATFELTERPGGICGSGTGHTAQAAFEIRNGKIVRWLRVNAGQTPGAPSDLT